MYIHFAHFVIILRIHRPLTLAVWRYLTSLISTFQQEMFVKEMCHTCVTVDLNRVVCEVRFFKLGKEQTGQDLSQPCVFWVSVD